LRTSLAIPIAVAALATAEVIGGASSSNAVAFAAAHTSAKKISIAYLTFFVNPFVQAEISGVRAGSGGTVTFFNSNYNPQTEMSQCQAALSSGRYTGIVLETVDGVSGIPCAALAAKQHIPVVGSTTALGKDPNHLAPSEPGVVGNVVLPPKQEGNLVLQEVKKACGSRNPCNVIHELITPSYSQSIGESKAFASDPNIKVVGQYSSDYDPAQTTANLPAVLHANPNTNVIYTASDETAVAAIKVVDRAGMAGKVRIVANGFSKIDLPALKNGSLYSTLLVEPHHQGSAMGNILKLAIEGKPIAHPGVSSYNLVPFPFVTPANVNKIAPQY
jgi:ABC-type sugar transport system substrate-binding protein